MALTAAKFQQTLGEELGAALGADYSFFRSRLELRAKFGDDDNVLILSGSNKYSPFISVSFYFGRNFAASKRIEKLMGKHQYYYHIQQYSPNRKAMNGLSYAGPYTWSVDITAPPASLVPEIASAVHGMAFPFFARFSANEAARDAIASDDPWCFGGLMSWRQLLLLDAAMDDLAHFRRWSEALDEFSRSQADEEFERVVAALRNVA